MFGADKKVRAAKPPKDWVSKPGKRPSIPVAPLLGLITILFLTDTGARAQPAADSRYDDMFGAWSPDGIRIAFTSDRTGDPEIFVANADGSGLRQLTNVTGRDAHPAWSPDGSRIAFQSPRHNGHTRIFIMNADGSGQRVLARTLGFCGVPAWSPDGRQIAFQCSSEPERGFGGAHAPWRIYLMNSDGRALRLLTEGPGNDQVPTWSPDGTRLLYFSNREGADQLYEYHFRSRRTFAITRGNPHRAASYSPDGERIALMTGPPDARADIYLLERRRLAYRRVTTDGPHFGIPQFSPNGERLLFQAPTAEGQRLHLWSLNGSAPASVLTFRHGEIGTGRGEVATSNRLPPRL